MCEVTSGNNEVAGGKPGVALCRFRPGDGRIFAVGGWDKRLRIFDRSAAAKSAPLAILRGHIQSVNAMDWAPDAAESGLLATGASDGRIYVWRQKIKAERQKGDIYFNQYLDPRSKYRHGTVLAIAPSLRYG